ncbi:iron ABC transporter substrate-binding protein [Pseudonocardia petroleophila]|uniref:Extracellular solute-binding protein n=1 Tax=Pseudonocardia petroleophila TaxID=37331 RepID=A0A7G7ME11_9PSEU|nr:extracellular solute-binding protein [Pseudonocardia petroleophila]QNG51022.1 extracellular solute-binding protein [Pseudonocardia petroleophila]
MHPSSKYVSRTIALLTVGAALVACGGAPGPAPEAAAEGDGVLTIYSGRNEALVGPLIAQLEAAVGSPVEVRYGSTGEMAAQLLEEGADSPADLFFAQDAGALGAVAGAGLLAPLPADVLEPALERYRAADSTWVATSARARVVAYNTALVPEADLPASLDDLLDPRWAGQIGIAPSNASWLSFVTGLRLIRGEDGARQWLTAFAAQNPQRFDGNGAVVDAVAAGSVAAGLVNHYYLFEKIAELDPATYPVRNHYVANDPLGLVNVAGVGVTASADDPGPALEAVRYLLSTEGQQYLVDETAEYPVIAGVTPARTDVDLAPLESLSAPDVDLADLSSLAETETLLQEVGLL